MKKYIIILVITFIGMMSCSKGHSFEDKISECHQVFYTYYNMIDEHIATSMNKIDREKVYRMSKGMSTDDLDKESDKYYEDDTLYLDYKNDTLKLYYKSYGGKEYYNVCYADYESEPLNKDGEKMFYMSGRVFYYKDTRKVICIYPLQFNAYYLEDNGCKNDIEKCTKNTLEMNYVDKNYTVDNLAKESFIKFI